MSPCSARTRRWYDWHGALRAGGRQRGRASSRAGVSAGGRMRQRAKRTRSAPKGGHAAPARQGRSSVGRGRVSARSWRQRPAWLPQLGARQGSREGELRRDARRPYARRYRRGALHSAPCARVRRGRVARKVGSGQRTWSATRTAHCTFLSSIRPCTPTAGCSTRGGTCGRSARASAPLMRRGARNAGARWQRERNVLLRPLNRVRRSAGVATHPIFAMVATAAQERGWWRFWRRRKSPGR